MPIELMELPFAENALEPHISANTLSFHYGKHHAGYVKKLNKQLDMSDYAGIPLKDVVIRSASEDQAIFNNAAQIWNHNEYWLSLSPDGGGEPPEKLATALTDAFGSVDEFKKTFATACGGQFGSGWGWLVLDGLGNLAIRTTTNAETPLTAGETVLLCCDVWEHAYYLDYQNARPDYLQHWWEIVNWAHAEERLDS